MDFGDPGLPLNTGYEPIDAVQDIPVVAIEGRYAHEYGVVPSNHPPASVGDGG